MQRAARTGEWFKYSFRIFTGILHGTEIDFAVDICEQVSAEWGATAEDPIILNLPGPCRDVDTKSLR
ncbi:MAG: hypothetical protein Ct9H300mP26_2920 [Acidimicrobiales bacterium]|nr:MAG: hypothetical protein Ct9H300mP26_2920 [Acidimicrobiales bacterium]